MYKLISAVILSSFIVACSDSDPGSPEEIKTANAILGSSPIFYRNSKVFFGGDEGTDSMKLNYVSCDEGDQLIAGSCVVYEYGHGKTPYPSSGYIMSNTVYRCAVADGHGTQQSSEPPGYVIEMRVVASCVSTI